MELGKRGGEERDGWAHRGGGARQDERRRGAGAALSGEGALEEREKETCVGVEEINRGLFLGWGAYRWGPHQAAVAGQPPSAHAREGSGAGG
jgi:hypothetical protein